LTSTKPGYNIPYLSERKIITGYRAIQKYLPKERVIIQAGTCYWPRKPRSECRPDELYQFGCQWSPDDPASIEQMLLGNLPEMHVWLALPERQEIIDFSCDQFPEACLRLTGNNWPGPRPPSYFWQKAEDEGWPEGVIYHPEETATSYAGKRIVQLLRARRGLGTEPGVEIIVIR
jgi:hypothetical protein